MTPIRLNSVDGIGDYIHSEDVARAITALLRADRLTHRVYNIASGVVTTTAELIQWAAEKAPGLRAEIVAPEHADILQTRRCGPGCGVPTTSSRIVADTGWRPRPVREAFLGYMDWIAAQRITE